MKHKENQFAVKLEKEMEMLNSPTLIGWTRFYSTTGIAWAIKIELRMRESLFRHRWIS
jgi:hypothetical protein